jgi:putative two-component system response regulator
MPALEFALDAYDRGTWRHCARVGFISSAIGDALALPDETAEALGWAAVLHDLGKLAIPATILDKPGPLDADEWRQVKRHPTTGAEMLLSISDSLRPIADGVRAHHERWDGSGYPDGLAGTAIPITGRIISVADVFDSLRSPRSYRDHVHSDEYAAQFVVDAAGRAFDPAIVDVFTRLQAAGRFATLPNNATPPAQAPPSGGRRFTMFGSRPSPAATPRFETGVE